ncbi:hypothetical protein P879_01489 [Paragonimus westermani]|uniref:Neural cell adhesion molecule n=1 Tax=Paragonimus westermani TaxID=34504 RepID=A0A8T0DPE0_9TREM|nr:hypothetical protein P879_01489 [Paragonimus westermani]
MRRSTIIFAILCIVSSAGAIDLRIEGKDNRGRIFVQAGDNLALTCVYYALSLEGSVLEWYSPSSPRHPVSSSSKASVYWKEEVGKKRYILVVRSVSIDDSGKYTCRMGRQDGDRFREMARDEVDVVVERSILATDCPTEQWIPLSTSNQTLDKDSVYSTQSVTIRCTIQALPSPIIDWRFRGKQISTGSHYTISVTGLTIFQPTEEDAGIYTVIARQPQHTAVYDIQVFVFNRPRITYGPVILGPYENAVVNNREAYLQCLAEGNPPPTVRWYRLRDPQMELNRLDPHKYFVNTNHQVGTLRIARAQFPEDSDIYICRALVSVPNVYDQSSMGMFDEARLQINVTFPPHLIPLTTMNRFVDLGDSVTVQCKVRATDPLELYYQKLYSNESYVIGTQPNDSRIEVRLELDEEDRLNHNLYLTIHNTTHQDTWNYTCYAHNVGCVRYWNTTIQVMQRPQMLRPVHSTSSLDEWSTLRFGWRYNATNLTCGSSGMPHPTWTWYRRGEQILNAFNSTFNIISWDHWNWSQSWLQITPCRHTEHFIYDEYVCKATNIKGTNESKVRLERASVPGQPVLVNYTVTQSTLDLNVEAPTHTGGMPPLGYELMYTAFGGPGRWYGPVYFPLDASTEAGRPRFRIHGLLGGIGYQVRLAARSIVGSGTAYEFSVRTLDSTRPGPVRIKEHFFGTYPYSQVVQWETPLNGGLPIIGYRIRIRPVHLLSPETLNPEQAGADPTVIGSGPWHQFTPQYNNPYINYYYLTNLDPDQVYQVVVEAENERGFSLDGIDINQYGYLNRTPSDSPRLIHQSDVRTAITKFTSRQSSVLVNDLVPIWSVFKTPSADLLGRPPRIFGSAVRIRNVPVLILLFTMYAVLSSAAI